MNTYDAAISVNQLLNQIDRDTEIIPFNNFEKLITLLEFIKGSILVKEEKEIALNLTINK